MGRLRETPGGSGPVAPGEGGPEEPPAAAETENGIYEEEGVPEQPGIDHVEQDSLLTNMGQRLEGLCLPPLPQDLVVFVGFLGDSPRNPTKPERPPDEETRGGSTTGRNDRQCPDDYRRLYLTLQMNDYIEFRARDVVAYRDLGGSPISGLMLWFRKGAVVEHVRVETLELQRGFIQGDITSIYAAGAGTGWANIGGGSYNCGGGSYNCGGGSYNCGGGSYNCGGGGSFGFCR